MEPGMGKIRFHIVSKALKTGFLIFCKIRFHIVSKALKTGFLIFCMRNKVKQKKVQCLWLEIPQADNVDFLSLRHKSKALKVNFVIIHLIKIFFLIFFVLSCELTIIQRKPLSVFAAPFFGFSKAGNLVSLSNINGQLVKQMLKQFQILFLCLNRLLS